MHGFVCVFCAFVSQHSHVFRVTGCMVIAYCSGLIPSWGPGEITASMTCIISKGFQVSTLLSVINVQSVCNEINKAK